MNRLLSENCRRIIFSFFDRHVNDTNIFLLHFREKKNKIETFFFSCPYFFQVGGLQHAMQIMANIRMYKKDIEKSPARSVSCDKIEKKLVN